jgi:hypothetical protein
MVQDPVPLFQFQLQDHCDFPFEGLDSVASPLFQTRPNALTTPQNNTKIPSAGGIEIPLFENSLSELDVFFPAKWFQQSSFSRTSPVLFVEPVSIIGEGHAGGQGPWVCNYPQCTSRVVFSRLCDFRKHYNRHLRFFFCRYESCSRATEGGFPNKTDRARHEAQHNPRINCILQECERVFSRVDNMVRMATKWACYR